MWNFPNMNAAVAPRYFVYGCNERFRFQPGDIEYARFVFTLLL